MDHLYSGDHDPRTADGDPVADGDAESARTNATADTGACDSTAATAAVAYPATRIADPGAAACIAYA